MNKIKYLSLFTGIGAFEKAMTNLAISYELVGFSEINNSAVKSYCAIHNIDESKNLGDITKIKTENISADFISYGFPCFVGETLIMTLNGSKYIKDLTIDDYVLTHTNTYKKVLKLMINQTDTLYKLDTSCNHELKATEEHPFYVLNKNNLTEVPKWVNVKDLTTNNYVGCAINNIEELPTWSGISYIGQFGHKKTVNNIKDLFENVNFWWLVGRYIRNYTFDEKKLDRKKHDERTIIYCSKVKTNEKDDIKNILDLLNLHYNMVEETTVYKFHIVNKELTNFLYQFGHLAHNKHLTSSIINLPIELLKNFIIGYESAHAFTDQKGYHKLSSVSELLIYDLAQCIMKVYKRPVSIYKHLRKEHAIIENRIVNQRHTYMLTYKIENNLKLDRSFYKDGYIWCQIHDIIKEEINTTVYNIEVENDNSYCVNNCIVHNCQSISDAGKKEGFKKDSGTRSSLLWEAIRLINDIKPKYCVAENVKALLSDKFKDDFELYLKELRDIGYNNYYKVLNSANYNIPQQRNRVFIVSIRKDVDDNTFKFNDGTMTNLSLKDFLEKQPEPKYYYPHKNKILQEELLKIKNIQLKGFNIVNGEFEEFLYEGMNKNIIMLGNINPSRNGMSGRVYSDRGLFKTLTLKGNGYIYENFKQIRRLTELECFKIMGFTEDDYIKAYNAQLEWKKGKCYNSEQLYFQAGNSIVVQVLESFLSNLLIV